MTNPDPFAALSRNERAALDDLCSRSVLLRGDVQRIAFLHNASFSRVRSLLPSYREQAAARRSEAAETVRTPPTDEQAAALAGARAAVAQAAPKPKPSKWSRARK